MRGVNLQNIFGKKFWHKTLNKLPKNSKDLQFSHTSRFKILSLNFRYYRTSGDKFKNWLRFSLTVGCIRYFALYCSVPMFCCIIVLKNIFNVYFFADTTPSNFWRVAPLIILNNFGVSKICKFFFGPKNRSQCYHLLSDFKIAINFPPGSILFTSPKKGL